MTGHDADEHLTAAYEIAGRQYDLHTPGFTEVIARAHASQQRPRCTCVPGGIETYVAKLNDGYVVKRMPDTGNQHASRCPHFEPAADASGLGPLLGTAIREDPVSGLTTLRLDFSMTRSSQRQSLATSATTASSTARICHRLSMRGLLFYLWEQAGLLRWQPGFAGKRSWATVRRRLLQAAGDKIIGGRPLMDRIYLPEPFNVDDRDAISRRRSSRWAASASGNDSSGQLLLLIGELKELAPARCGYRALVKHVPDQALLLDERLYSRITKLMRPALALWNAAEDVRMLVIATFGIGVSGVPTISETVLAPTSREWIPIEDGFEHQLVDRLVSEGRSFVKIAHINPRRPGLIRSATLLDCPESPSDLLVDVDADWASSAGAPGELDHYAKWIWHVAEGSMPSLPTASLIPTWSPTDHTKNVFT